MHTYTFSNYKFIYHKNLSGSVDIVNVKTDEKIKLPCKGLLSFVANVIREEKISGLSNMTDHQILFGE